MDTDDNFDDWGVNFQAAPPLPDPASSINPDPLELENPSKLPKRGRRPRHTWLEKATVEHGNKKDEQIKEEVENAFQKAAGIFLYIPCT